jgi:hypothetical protein
MNPSLIIGIAILGLITFASFSYNIVTNHTLISYAQINSTATSSPVEVLPSALGVKIASPTNNEQVYLGNNNLKIIGTSTDSINSNCDVSVTLNDVKPYQHVLPTGPGGNGDYSLWGFLLTPEYNSTIKEGPNKLTAKLLCSNINVAASDLATYYTVYFKGVSSMPTNTTISSSTINQRQSSVTTSTIPAAIDANTTSISTLASPINNSSNNDNSTANIATPILASIDTPVIPKPLFIKITSHTQNQTVQVNKPLKISGISSDNVNSHCTVYADWNDQKPLQRVTPTGPNGINDYSNWTFTYTSNYHLMTEGANELTSKLDCGTGQVKYYTVNVTGVYDQQPRLAGAMTDNNVTISSSVNREPSSSVPPNTDDMEDSSSDSESSNTGNNGDNCDGTGCEANGGDNGDKDNGDILEDKEENIGNNNDLFEENDETDSSDEEIGDLFE